MSNYRVTGYIEIGSTGETASYEVFIDDFTEVPNEMEVLHVLLETGDLQIINQTWEEVDEFGVGV